MVKSAGRSPRAFSLFADSLASPRDVLFNIIAAQSGPVWFTK
jgi:hypothetical protein